MKTTRLTALFNYSQSFNLSSTLDMGFSQRLAIILNRTKLNSLSQEVQEVEKGLGAWILAVLFLANSCERLAGGAHQDGVGGPLDHLVQRQLLQHPN